MWARATPAAGKEEKPRLTEEQVGRSITDFRIVHNLSKMSSATKKSKNDKEREKIVQDRLQILLTRMLQDDDNKYCVDCDSKGNQPPLSSLHNLVLLS